MIRWGHPDEGAYRLTIRSRFYDEKAMFRVALATMREEELMEFRNFIDETIELALPLARKKDQEAKEDNDNGIPNKRNYRRVSEIHTRNWPE